MRHVARQEGTSTRPADRHLIADLEGDLAIEDVSDLVAVVVDVEIGNGSDRRDFLEHHHALGGLAVLQLERERPAGRGMPYYWTLAGGQHDPMQAHDPLLS
jgi:hypothetical protein